MLTNIHRLKRLAEQKEEENWQFRQFLKFYDKLSDDELDRLVCSIAESIESQVKCTLCGQCCRELKPGVSQQDQQRLADGLGMTIQQLRTQYLEYDRDDHLWKIKGPPCVFHNTKKCTVYAHRSEQCRAYPYLHEPQFSDRTMAMIGRTYTCPIVFEVMEELKQRLHFRAR